MAEPAASTFADALIALGGNVGDVRSTFDRAVAMLCDGDAVRLLARSSDYRTPPWGLTDQPPFINAVIAVATSLSPRDLLARALMVERAFGRDRGSERRWGPRTLDLDLLAYDDLILNSPDLTLPHPRLFERAFVLVPLDRNRPRPGDCGHPRDRRAQAHRRKRHRKAAAAVDLTGTAIAQQDVLALPGQAWHFASMTAAEPLSFAADFPAATHDEWRRLVDSVLKGAPFQRLESKTYDRLTIEPLYDRAAAARAVTGRAPGAAWTLMQRVDHPDPAVANAQALEDLENGATGLVLVFAGSVSANGFGLDASAASLARVLDGIDFAGAAIDLNLSPATRHVVRDIAALVKSRGMAPAAADLRFSINPIGGFAASGKSARGWDELAKSFAAMVGELAGAGFRGPFAVADGRIIHNAGGSEAQELAFALASAVAYLRALETGGIALEAARDAIYFRLTADADQFLTVAKFRAARKLWARIEAACGLTPKPALLDRRNGVAHDDAARSLREHAAHHDRGRCRRLWRRRRHHGAAAYRAARPAGRLCAPRRAQHAACSP